jgi:hypothetical protein
MSFSLVENVLHEPYTVLVLHNRVWAVYPYGDVPDYLDRVEEVVRACGLSVIVYAVDSRLPPPPATHAIVEPSKLQWIEVERYELAEA